MGILTGTVRMGWLGTLAVMGAVWDGDMDWDGDNDSGGQ